MNDIVRERSWWRWRVAFVNRVGWGIEIGLYHGCHRRTFIRLGPPRLVVSLNQPIAWAPTLHVPTCRLFGRTVA